MSCAGARMRGFVKVARPASLVGRCGASALLRLSGRMSGTSGTMQAGLDLAAFPVRETDKLLALDNLAFRNTVIGHGYFEGLLLFMGA